MLSDLHDGLRVVQKERDGILEEMAADAMTTITALQGAVSARSAWITTGGPFLLPSENGDIRIDHGSGTTLTHERPGRPKRAFHLTDAHLPDDDIAKDPTSFAMRLLLAIISISRANERSVHTLHPATIAVMREACGIHGGMRMQDSGLITLTYDGPFGEGTVRMGIPIGKKGAKPCRPPSLKLLPGGIAVRKSERDGSRYIMGPIVEMLDGTTIDTLSVLRSEAALERLRSPSA